MKDNKCPTISLCMIVKNEEETIGRCLECVQQFVDEIVIVDTGSTDKTKEIVQTFTDSLYEFEWINDFAAARNFAFSNATKDYILWLDADDIIDEENQQKFIELKSSLTFDVDAVSMFYHLTFDTNGNPNFSLRRNRLVKRERNFKWHGYVHEYLEVYGNIKQSDIGIKHKKEKTYTDRNLQLYKAAEAAGKTFSPRDTYYYANECADHGHVDKAIELYTKFLDDGFGWSEDNIQACGKLSDAYSAKKEVPKAIQSCINSFKYDTPRGEICCRLGFIYLDLNLLDRAIFWYDVATRLEVPENKSPFINYACYTWLPNLQLCLCYSRLEKFHEAKKHNDLAASYNPTNPSIIHNQRYLEGVFKERGLN
ncbi:glycosyltransferase [Priestia taiwanensis]|uniref:Beta 1,4 glucosyltransferase n=1 Tax=Priestia taiwanensis TaxID=1347902 RepID=A0A917ELX8_9BACI|nr:glycosyltransferase family 2 protein [Priestia taiwanensis]MBM7361428.1 glycosyltransferase involved in cell wall biosynthesis [Priestia taiwanensis]GGE54053.1 beta 1,4 glucosyltransferase [Priestia taiwanensis]